MLQWIITFVVLFVVTFGFDLIIKALDENLHTEGDVAFGVGIKIVLALVWIFVVARVRNRMLRKTWQKAARSADQELMRAGSRRPILYLRSFALDERIDRPHWTEKWLGFVPMEIAEPAITKDLRKLGPTIAIGRPDEKLPGLGAARFYVSHDRWQAKVAEITKESQLVLMATGVTEGLRWEIGHLVETVPPEKIILWAHPHLLRLSPKDREAEWTRFRTMLGGVFPKPLPETLGEARFIYFHADWTPVPVAPRRRPWGYFNAERSALKAVLQAKRGKVAEAKIVYTGLREGDNFASLIGAEGRPVRWPRAAGFVASCFLAALASLIVKRLSFPPIQDEIRNWVNPLLDAILFSVVAIAIFRLIRNPWFAAIATAVVYVLLLWPVGLLGYGAGEYESQLEMLIRLIWIDSWAAPFQVMLLFLFGLIWTTRRMAPLFWALLIGGLLYPAIFWLHVLGAKVENVGEEQAFQYMCVRPAVFAICFAIVVWLTKKRRSGGTVDVANNAL